MKKLSKIVLGFGMTLVGSVALAQCDVANLAAWTTTNNPDAKIDVTAAAAMVGNCGLAVETFAQPGGQSTKHFVQDSSPVDEAR